MKNSSNNHEKMILRTDLSLSLLNAVRRSVQEIPILAIDDIEIYKNDSALYDEVLAHRLGLIPLKTEKSMSSKTQISLKLSKTGPCTVYAEDLKGPIEIPYPKIPIVILRDGHTLELSCTATVGLGIDHAKYTPGLCFYRNLLEVKSSSEIDKIIQSSKTDFTPEKKGNKWLCDLTDHQINQIESKDKDAIKDSDEKIFIIESYGSLNPEEILKEAKKVLSSNLDEFEKKVGK